MAQLYEHYNVGDDAEAQTMWSATTWGAQTFTPSVAHRIISVRLKLQRHGLTPGTFTVSIRATSVGKPSNGDLCVGTIDGDDISDAAGGEWWEITLGGGSNLGADTLYGIVCRGLGFTVTNFVGWRQDKDDATYAGGAALYSTNAGVGWSSAGILDDLMFEEYGPDESSGGGKSANMGNKMVAAGLI